MSNTDEDRVIRLLGRCIREAGYDLVATQEDGFELLFRQTVRWFKSDSDEPPARNTDTSVACPCVEGKEEDRVFQKNCMTCSQEVRFKWICSVTSTNPDHVLERLLDYIEQKQISRYKGSEYEYLLEEKLRRIEMARKQLM